MYKLIAVDMDGTLLREDKTVSERTKQAIQMAHDQGVKVVLASGRPIEGLNRYLEELGLCTEEDYVLSYNGSIVQNVGTREVIAKSALKGTDLMKLYKLSKELGVNIHAFSKDGCITPKMNEYSQLEGRINGIPVHEVDYDTISEEEDIVKIMLIDPVEVLEEVIKKLPEILYDEYTIVRSAPYFLEFLNKKSGKAVGVKALSEHLGIKREEVICIGDAGNDLDMIEYAGLGVAMGNAFDEVKKVADYITDSNEEDGVAKVIEKFIAMK
ncbi:sugar-phosphatase [Cellulosilyticum ruminicola]|uniref:sugar-phosphatase n=1 Tax=Cellulosilyticum ruminicola TaxID=425254 RepID=UPI0006D075AE|nr:sugar-phosphatase [Cellulosilyticum ruminicola]